MVAGLSEIVDEWAELDPASCSDAALASELLALRAQMDRLEGVFARLADAAHQRGIGSGDGATSTAAWLRWQAGMREGEARAAIEAGAAGRDLLTETGDAWRSGAIPAGAARTIIAARVDGHDDELRASRVHAARPRRDGAISGTCAVRAPTSGSARSPTGPSPAPATVSTSRARSTPSPC